MKFPLASRFATYDHLSVLAPASVYLLILRVLICDSYSQFSNPQFSSATVYLFDFWEPTGCISSNTDSTCFQLILVM